MPLFFMDKFYTIIIPVFNEQNKISKLLDNVKPYSDLGHEIIIVDDGSFDNTLSILLKNKFIKLLPLAENQGKGVALKKGINHAQHNRIIIFDGDLELNPKDIGKLMILNQKLGISCVFGHRYETINPFETKWELGNFLLTYLFNLVNNTNLKDALCCGKAFYKSDIVGENLKSKRFDIDVELSAILIKRYHTFRSVKLEYARRYKDQGKKLNLSDSISIIKRIINS